jgi:hypothetical protein
MGKRYNDVVQIGTSLCEVFVAIIQQNYQRALTTHRATKLTRSWPSFASLKAAEQPFDEQAKALQEWLKQQQHHSNNTIHHTSQEAKIPVSQWSRLWHYAGLATEMGLGAAQEALKRATSKEQGEGGSSGLLLNERNAERLVRSLCRMRGAALKLGQMLSLQGEFFHQ